MPNLKPSQITSLVGLIFSALGTVFMGVSTVMRNNEANQQLVELTQETLVKLFGGEGAQV